MTQDLKTRNEFATELAKGSDISIPKAARVIDYLVSEGFDLKLTDVENIMEPGWGRIMEFPLYELSSNGLVRSYYTKKQIPVSDTGEVTLHRNDGSAVTLNVKDLVGDVTDA
jgi:hypothetical protein